MFRYLYVAARVALMRQPVRKRDARLRGHDVEFPQR
jgi:hypothetical protein